MDKNLDSLPSKELLHSESLNTSGGHLEVVELCANGADIDSQDDRKLSFLMAAFREGYVDVFKLLVNRLTQFPSDQEMDRFMTTVTDKEMIKKCSQFVDTIRIAKERQAAEANKNANIFLEMESLVWSHILIKTGLTSLMGADVDVPPVPASHTVRNVIDEKGQLIQLIYDKATIVNVKNKKGQSVLWLAATAGHLDLVKLLHENGANIDSQDNREVSCLMAAFRTGQDKVVEWMVKHVKQFPSDQEMDRIKKTVTDEVMKEKCSQCEHIIRIAKEVKAAEAEKNFTDLADLDMKKSREENQKAAGARKKEKKRQKKREKQAQLRAVKAAAEESEKSEKSDDHPPSSKLHLSDPSDDEDEKEEEVEKNDSEILPSETNQELSRITAISNRPSKSKPIQIPSLSGEKLKEPGCLEQDSISCVSVKCNSDSRSDKKKDKVKTQEKNKRNISNKTSGTESSTENEILVAEKHSPKAPDSSAIVINTSAATTCSRVSKKRSPKQDSIVNCSSIATPVNSIKSITSTVSPTSTAVSTVDTKCQNVVLNKHYKQMVNGISGNSIADYTELCALLGQNPSIKGKKNSIEKLALDPYSELTLDLSSDVALSAGLRSPSGPNIQHSIKSPLTNSASPKKWQKRDEGWKEVVRSKLFNRSKKVSVPANAISRVIGRGGMNINAIREHSGAHIEIEKQKGQGDRTVIIRGSPESTRLAQNLITMLIKEPEKDIRELFNRCGINKPNSSLNSVMSESFKTSCITINNPSLSTSAQVSSVSSQSKNVMRQHIVTRTSGNAATSVTKTTSIPPPSLPANATPPFTNQFRSVVTNTQNIRPCIPVCSTATPPFLNNAQNAWTGVVMSGKVPANVPRPSVPICTASATLNVSSVSTRVVAATSAVEKNSVSRQLFPPDNKSSVSPGSTTATKTTVSYTMAVIAQSKAAKTVPANIVTVATKVTATSDTKVSISPISMERAGSAPPSSAIVHNQMSLNHSTCTGPLTVQPFATSHSPKVSNSSVSQQNNTVPVSRIQMTQAPVQSKPFLNSAVPASHNLSTSNPSSTPPVGSPNVTSAPSSLPQEYTPFNHVFANVGPSVWCPKEKETSKPNFASVAASGVTSVASPVQNSNPVQSSLTLTLPISSEADIVIDAAKAPGYRGNLHISPSASSSSPASSSAPQISISNSNFGPIGSGPRSAPCTPPLGPIGPPSSAASSTRRSTPPAVPSPPPPPLIPRSLQESQTLPLNELPRSVAGGLPPPHMSSQASEVMFHHQNMELSFHPSRLQSFPMAATLASPGGTNTTYSQHSPLPSVGTILLEGGNNGPMQVVQSNLNPNAPDFSSRNSLLMTSQGPHLHHLPRLPSGANNFQENSVPSHLPQFRPIFTSGGGMSHSFPLHAMANAQTAMNRFPFHHVPNHQQQTDFSNPSGSAGTIGSVVSGLSQGAESMPMLSMVPGYGHPSTVLPGSGNIPHHYPGLPQSMMGIRQNQQSASTTPSVGTSSKDEGSPAGTMSPNPSPQGSNLPSPTGMSLQDSPNPAGTIGEDRKLPRPIGMERAQRKNPVFGGVSDVGIWSYNSSGRSDIPATGGDWMHSMQNTMQPIQQEEAAIPPSVHNYTGNRFPDVLPVENSHSLEQSYQQAIASGGYPFVNGLPPPHLIAPHLYPNNVASPVDAQVEMWGVHPKTTPVGDAMPQNVEQKMTWQSWSPHQA